MRAQVQWSFYYIMISLLAVAILIFGFLLLKGYEKTDNSVVLINFQNSMGKSLEVQSLYSFGSVTERTLSLPSNAEKVCFVDENKDFNALVDRELNKAIEEYTSYNIFISPIDQYMPFDVEYLILNESPLCVKVVNGKVKLRLESYGAGTLVSAANINDKEVECVSVWFNDEPDNSIDVVFLGNDYSDIESFGSDVNRYIQTFRATEPFSSNLEKINFYRIDEFKDIGCNTVTYGLGGYLICGLFETKALASECPFDYVVVLVNRGVAADVVWPLRSSAQGNVMTLNSAENELVMLHEFAHGFANLADEYVDNDYYSQINFDEEDYANCDQRPCNEWSVIRDTEPSVGCFQGCSLSAVYRSTEDSLMNSFDTNDFGPVNENEISKRLDVYER